MSMLDPVEYRGFVLTFIASCKEVDYSAEGVPYYTVVDKFKTHIDNILSDKSTNNKVRQGYYEELDKLREKANKLGMGTYDLRVQLNEIYILFYKLLDLKIDDVTKDYFERVIEEHPKTKMIGELKIGDIVILPYCKGTSTISNIEKSEGIYECKITFEGIGNSGVFKIYDEVTFIGNKND